MQNGQNEFPIPLSYLGVIRDGQRTLPVRVGEICTQLGMRLFGKKLDPRVMGKIEVSEEGETVVTLNSVHSMEKQRLCSAFLTGHWILSNGVLKQDLTCGYFFKTEAGEELDKKALAIAYDILMPWRLITDAAKKGVFDTDELSKAFFVTPVCMARRLDLPC